MTTTDAVRGTTRQRTPAPRETDPAPRRNPLEHLLVAAGVLLMLISVVQVSLWIYTRSLLTSAAGDAAEYSGHADVSTVDVTERVADLLGDGMAAGTKDSLHCTRITTLKRVEVRCVMDAPGAIGLLAGVLPQITAVDHVARDPDLAAVPNP